MVPRSNRPNDSPPPGRAATDSVHQRLKPENIYCPSCEKNIDANKIDEHFVRSHESKDNCVYCGGKVFEYLIFRVNDDGNQVYKPQTYHSCNV